MAQTNQGAEAAGAASSLAISRTVSRDVLSRRAQPDEASWDDETVVIPCESMDVLRDALRSGTSVRPSIRANYIDADVAAAVSQLISDVDDFLDEETTRPMLADGTGRFEVQP